MTEKKKADKPEEGPRNFTHFLGQIQNGEFHTEAGEVLQQVTTELAKRASRHGRSKGTITLKIMFEHEQRGDDMTTLVAVRGEIDAKLPKRVPPKSLFYSTPGGNLSSRDPKQLDLPLREVATEQPVRDVASPAPITKEI